MWVTCVSNTWSSTSFSITVLQLWTTITSLKTFFEFWSERVSLSRYRWSSEVKSLTTQRK